MKFLVSAIVLLSSSLCLAGGNLTFTNQIYDGKVKVNPMVGLAVDQHIFDRIYLTSWAGFGQRPLMMEDKSWGSAKLGLDYRMDRLTIGAGMGLNTTAEDLTVISKLFGNESEQLGYVKLSYKLW